MAVPIIGLVTKGIKKAVKKAKKSAVASATAKIEKATGGELLSKRANAKLANIKQSIKESIYDGAEKRDSFRDTIRKRVVKDVFNLFTDDDDEVSKNATTPTASTKKRISEIEMQGVFTTQTELNTLSENTKLAEKTYTLKATRDMWIGAPASERENAIINAFSDKKLANGSNIETLDDVTQWLKENDKNMPNFSGDIQDIEEIEKQINEVYTTSPINEDDFGVDWDKINEFNSRAWEKVQ